MAYFLVVVCFKLIEINIILMVILETADREKNRRYMLLKINKLV